MPKPHSLMFNNFVESCSKQNETQNHITHNNATVKIKTVDIVQAIRNDKLENGVVNGGNFYDRLSDLLKETNDAQFGIVSTVENGMWVRDATSAIPLGQRIPHHHPAIEANNALLRCLGRLKAIDYAIYKHNPTKASEIREMLKQQFASHTQLILDSVDQSDALEQINQYEKQFNTLLISALHRANLTEGLSSKKEAQKLLFHYRNLSSLMIPARPLVTLTYDKAAQVLQRESQFPVCKKQPSRSKRLANWERLTHTH